MRMCVCWGRGGRAGRMWPEGSLSKADENILLCMVISALNHENSIHNLSLDMKEIVDLRFFVVGSYRGLGWGT